MVLRILNFSFDVYIIVGLKIKISFCTQIYIVLAIVITIEFDLKNIQNDALLKMSEIDTFLRYLDNTYNI